MTSRRLVLLDVHAILHRAYHALPDFTSSKGEPTGALYGLMTMLISIVKDVKPDYVVACFDLPGPTFRKTVYKEYKATRGPTEDALVAQIKRAHGVFEALSIPCYQAEGFEADDILGTIVKQLTDDETTEVVIASGDMDTLQLTAYPRVKVYTLRKGLKDTVLYDAEAVRERYHFSPEHIPDYKGLRGDPSDNIPGIAGIGEKTATTLITTYGDLEALYAKLKENPEAMRSETKLSERMINLLTEGEEEAFFSKLLAEIRTDAPITFTMPSKRWRDEFNWEAFKDLLSELEFRTLGDRFKAMFIKEEDVEPGSLFTDEVEAPPEADELIKVGIAAWLINSDLTNPTLSDVLRFSGESTFKAAKAEIMKRLLAEGLEEVYQQFELPVHAVIQRMNQAGVLIDQTTLKNLSERYHQELDLLSKKITEAAGREFNLNSPKQLGEVLFDELALPTKGIKKTATGGYSTAESELEKLREVHPIISHILEYRTYHKLVSTYIDALPTQISEDGRLRSTFVQTGSTTGRLASLNPNLQNIPVKTELGRQIRKAFVAEAGKVLVAFDYSQIELRIAAILSEDSALQEIFKSGDDIHSATAARVFGVKREDVTKNMRRQAKVINFGILYGMGVNALRANLSEGGEAVSRAEAQTFLEQYFAAFPELSTYLDETKRLAAKQGFVETLFGRRRSFPGIHSHIPYIKAAAERMAINAPIQGTQADVIKRAMVQIDEMIARAKLRDEIKLILQVHDEVIYEIKKNLVGEYAPKIKKIMESVLTKEQTKGVPIVAEANAGSNWYDLEPLT